MNDDYYVELRQPRRSPLSRHVGGDGEMTPLQEGLQDAIRFLRDLLIIAYIVGQLLGDWI